MPQVARAGAGVAQVSPQRSLEQRAAVEDCYPAIQPPEHRAEQLRLPAPAPDSQATGEGPPLRPLPRAPLPYHKFKVKFIFDHGHFSTFFQFQPCAFVTFKN